MQSGFSPLTSDPVGREGRAGPDPLPCSKAPPRALWEPCWMWVSAIFWLFFWREMSIFFDPRIDHQKSGWGWGLWVGGWGEPLPSWS